VFSVLLIISSKEKNIIRVIFYFISLVAFVRLVRLDLIYISAIPVVLLVFLKFKKNFFSYINVKKLILLYTIIASLVYFEKLIVSREWQDIYQANWQKSYDGGEIDKKFKGLKWLSNLRIEEWELTSLFLAPLKIKYLLFLILPSLLFFYYDMQKIKDKKSSINFDIWIIYLLLFGLFLILALHESYTWNQAVTFAILTVFSVLLIISSKEKNIIRVIFYFISLVAFVRLVRLDLIYISAIPVVLLVFLKFKKNFFSYINVKKLILLYTIIASLVYFEKLIVSREWQDIYQANWQKSYDGGEIDKKFKGLKWLSNLRIEEWELTSLFLAPLKIKYLLFLIFEGLN
jgi:hypothetical protein